MRVAAEVVTISFTWIWAYRQKVFVAPMGNHTCEANACRPISSKGASNDVLKCWLNLCAVSPGGLSQGPECASNFANYVVNSCAHWSALFAQIWTHIWAQLGLVIEGVLV